MTGSTTNTRQLSFWQLIFLQSKMNDAPYHGEELPLPVYWYRSARARFEPSDQRVLDGRDNA
ncbi:MAG: hypothetical protein HY694_13095 [Deltaproteobacteria bacterium]|nr:hypothetical protein [Deltaproteobacteria bacterium]